MSSRFPPVPLIPAAIAWNTFSASETDCPAPTTEAVREVNCLVMTS